MLKNTRRIIVKNASSVLCVTVEFAHSVFKPTKLHETISLPLV